MIFILLGIFLLILAFIFILNNKLQPQSEMMLEFDSKEFKKLMHGLIIGGTLLLTWGIYTVLFIQPSFLIVDIDKNQYVVSGEIGEIGYITDSFILQNKETKMSIVSWENIEDDNIHIYVEYPSGKKDTWKPNVTNYKNKNKEKLEKQYGIKEIFKLSPYTFKEKGNVSLTIKCDEKELSHFEIEVLEKEPKFKETEKNEILNNMENQFNSISPTTNSESVHENKN